jgi:hypothetical protein
MAAPSAQQATNGDVGVRIVPSLHKAKTGGRLAHTIRKFLGQDLGPGISAASLGCDFELFGSKGNASARARLKFKKPLNDKRYRNVGRRVFYHWPF